MFNIPAEIRAVLFDLNGTLIRDREAHRAAFTQIFQEAGITLTKEEYESKVANHLNRQIWPAVFGRNFTVDELEKLSHRKEEYYLALLPKLTTPTPGAAELLQTLKTSGIAVALVTTAAQGLPEKLLEHLGLSGCFDLMVTGSDVSRGKPDPEIYITTLDRLEVEPKEAIAFEDSPQGVQSACNAGIFTVGVLPEYPADILTASGAKALITDFTEVSAN